MPGHPCELIWERVPYLVRKITSVGPPVQTGMTNGWEFVYSLSETEPWGGKDVGSDIALDAGV